MASLIYNNALDALARGLIDFDGATIKVLLTTAAYTESKALHQYRNAISGEVVGTGYTAGGQTVSVGIATDNTLNRTTITLGGYEWASATFTARKAVYYVSRGGASSADELIAVVDFGADVTAIGTPFTLKPSLIRLNNT